MNPPQQPPYGPPVPPKKPMSTGGKIGIGCGGCLGLLLILFMFAGCMSVLSGDTSSTGGEDSPTRQEATGPAEETTEAEAEPTEESEESEEPEAEPEEEEEPEPETSSTIGNGVHRVGDDIEPGTYTTDGPDPDSLFPHCYYARLSGLSGEFDDIIANNNIEGPGTVVVAESDAALELSGDCEWTLE